MGECTQRKRQHRKTEAETIAVLRSPDDCTSVWVWTDRNEVKGWWKNPKITWQQQKNNDRKT